MTWNNKLYFGDNLKVLRDEIPDDCVDLIYLDPPFNSAANYNVLFADKSGQKSAAQIAAFEDTWHWNIEQSETAYQELVLAGGRLADLMSSLLSFLGKNDMMAYLVMMAVRLKELHRVLKPTGSLYLHCDPTASHYLKLILDAVFGVKQFRNEVIWKRTSAHVNPKRWGPVHDVLLFYTKSDGYGWNATFQAYDEDHLGSKYRNEDERGRYHLTDLTGAGTRSGDSGQPWRGIDPTPQGRHWAVPKDEVKELAGDASASLTTQQKLDLLDKNNYIYWPERGRGGAPGLPRFRRYLGDGMPIQDVVTDIFPINSQAQERLGYPTQKPEPLLERILKASSNEGDLIMDPFCGCGTAIAVAERLHRRWIGVDITHLAITLIRHRLKTAFGERLSEYETKGMPVDVGGAQELAVNDRYGFQVWALGLVDARPTGNVLKKGADKGVDGYIYFFDDNSGKVKKALVQVKSGGVKRSDIATLIGDTQREKAEIGVFVTLEEPTKPMQFEADAVGFYEPPYAPEQRVPKIQIVTIDQLLKGTRVQLPRLAPIDTFKKAPKQKKGFEPQQGTMF